MATRRRDAHDRIVVRGAREHNLKDVDLDIPRDALVVFTGLSGSGKSSLAFDTIYAEGQRRYVESLSAYARQFLGQMDKPDVDFIEGLSPAISIDQKSTSRNPRSTVGTITEIYDYLRLLYARIGLPHCPNCGRPIARQTAEQIVDQVHELPAGTRFQVLAPVVRGRKGEYGALFQQLSTEGYARVRVDGEVHPIDEVPRLEKNKKHSIEVVVDRLVQKSDMRRRLADSIETALQLADGIAMIEVLPTREAVAEAREQGLPEPQAEELVFSEHLACAHCGLSFEQLAPRNFSFNSPYGACETCSGLGTQLTVDPELVLGDPSLSVEDGVVLPWGTGAQWNYYQQLLRATVRHAGGEPATPWKDLSAEVRDAVLHGVDGRVQVSYTNRYGRRRSYKAQVEGVIPSLLRRHAETESDHVRQQVEQYMREVPCPACDGRRLKPLVLGVTVGGRSIAGLTAASVAEADAFVAGLELTEREQLIGARVIKEIRARLQFLLDVGLEYLTLDRAAGSLSGGEAQRIRLATQIGAGLVGVLYVLDEPSIGLHQRDNERLIETLVRLRDLGNTLIVVEHDEATIEAADHVVDIGPGAGEHGGEIVHSGSVEGLKRLTRKSLTGAYLSGERRIGVPAERRSGNGHMLTIEGATEHNLRDVTVDFPLGAFTCVTGVSGSGKSTLVNEILSRVLMRHVYGSRALPGKHVRTTGLEQVEKAVVVDQSPIGRTPRSNPATYTGVFDKVRQLFATTQEAKVRGYQPGRFSFNVKGGRCEACRGDGTLKIEMHFLPDVYVPCEVCKGRRYNRETLEVHYKGKTIAEVLALSVDEALEFFANIPSIAGYMQTLHDVGLGYVRLGQPATTLSGGEAQRVKLATELRKRYNGQTVYILDEPTTGLHFEDIRRLLDVLHRLVDKGNTVIVIEHNLDVIKTADHLIDLGPEGGVGGGSIVVTGTPEDVAATPASYTGKFLRDLLPT
ncbi:excinuclease ABC subunit UvrA [Egicoccus halophilus]|uniref:UvrABC system protein A n=1 Tax=Egicoccus halophilus TaxID=1670830 RepID=A0A8J3A8C4_9ACTN|nr:excinuclease ABC subunit UvrA [Egicoccus halophilus]GGI04489.1 UvrABC system protein A [Egicoccus halophilus]